MTKLTSIFLGCALATSFIASAVNKAKFDFVVGVDGDFKAAKAAAESSSSARFVIFFPNGNYNIGAQTGDSNQKTTLGKANVSLVGQSMNGVTLYNTSSTEGIGATATICLNSKCDNTYIQDLTLQNKARVDANAGANRYAVLQDQANRNIFKNVRMLSGQDTYYSTTGARRSYLEGCDIHGTVDFICGGGDIVFNKCSLYLEQRSNNVITAPAGTGNWGYVFLNCTIDGNAVNNGQYKLGRSWQKSPRSVWINTTMKVIPNAAGWGDPMNTCPALFAEYNSRNANGGLVDLSQRKSYYSCSKDGSTAYMNPVLSAQEAAKFTVKNVLSSTDNWQPDLLAKAAAAPSLSVKGNVISWNHVEEARCYVVFKNDVYVGNTVDNSFQMPANTSNSDVFYVRSANEMGGLGDASNKVTMGDLSELTPAFFFYYDNGNLSSSNNSEYNNVWTCSENDKADYAWSISSRDDKNILYGNDIVYYGKTYKTFKNSNGAQNTFFLPENVKPTKVTFIGYSNATDGTGFLTEVNGEQLSKEFAVNTAVANYQSAPSVVSYEFSEDVCDHFTFTFSTKQVCFIMALEVEEADCPDIDPETSIEMVAADDADAASLVYDLQGRVVHSPLQGRLYIRNGRKCMIQK